ncbi:LysM peptidoglycan-binding domain-containing protein [Brachybacterium halotolerans subsp. kimchii]|uniref:LysM peptidoglycan-binding domain-containing protein n=1 Tax=Brachybacterium halotolerans TaxID=2795215 RepID=UPI001E5E0ED4|nr:LysM peptidoglycan-binding domain-containing protein [Brachybacterium halotolerans]UEJ82608.1 LysM peptidoglycan-binding domain-containing protein [Brachybacterium halotolerans subsp. kimchii]
MSTTDRPSTHVTTRATGRRAALAMPLIAIASLAAGTVLLRAAAALQVEARSSYGTDALTALVLLAVAALGVLLCAYLALVHALAAVVMLRGADAVGSRALLRALRVLAPRLASRALATLAVTTAAAGLLAGPAQAQGTPVGVTSAAGSTASLASAPAAAPLMRLPGSQDPPPAHTDHTPSAQLPAEPDAPSPEEPTDQPDAGDEELPGLGWGDQEAPADGQNTPAGSGATGADDSSADDSSSDDNGRPDTLTVVVKDGDSLWSISDDLMGVGPDSPREISAAWPELFSENADVIGPDPDHIEPGQVLTVPDALPTSQENS